MNLIGVSGLAGVGKDLFARLFSKEISKRGMSSKRYALADKLKTEINETLIALYGVDIFNCSREAKDIVRPALVSHGKIKRKQTSGRYWIEQLEADLDGEFIKPDFACVTDVRHDEYGKDEVHWIKEERRGVLIHISKFHERDGVKTFQLPPNEDEAKNDPKLKAKADYLISWLHCEGNDFEQVLNYEVSKFSDWLLAKYGKKGTILETY